MKQIEIPAEMLPEGVTIRFNHELDSRGIRVIATLVLYSQISLDEREISVQSEGAIIDAMCNASMKAAKNVMTYAKEIAEKQYPELKQYAQVPISSV